MQTNETQSTLLESSSESSPKSSSDPQPLRLPSAPGTLGLSRSVWPLRVLPALAAVLVVAVLAGLFLGPLHLRGQGSIGVKATPTRPQPTPTLTTNIHVLTHDEILPDASIADVDMLSANDGWAVGYKKIDNVEFDSLILHYNGTHWSEASPVIQNAGLEAISMSSPTEGWAGGANESGPLGAVLLHYTGGRWVRVSLPQVQRVFRIQLLSADEAWAIGNTWDSSGTPTFYLLHYSDGVWSLADNQGMRVTTISMVSASEGWAAGEKGVIAYYTSGSWRRWSQSAPGDVTALTMVSPTNGWMAGLAPGSSEPDVVQRVFLLHFDGTSWQDVTLAGVPPTSNPIPNTLNDISMVSSSEGWGVGTLYQGESLIFHYTNGSWQPADFRITEPLFSVSMVAADEGWAVGGIQDHSDPVDDAGVLLHYSHGRWSVYKP